MVAVYWDFFVSSLKRYQRTLHIIECCLSRQEKIAQVCFRMDQQTFKLKSGNPRWKRFRKKATKSS